MTPEEIKQQLKYTWVPFFSRFGRLLPVQERAIPSILQKYNTVVISPAASGKTEAVIAPLIENILTREEHPLPPALRLLYITPTRALVNDLYRRLGDAVQYTGLNLSRKTGDRSHIDETCLPDILLTTPESFDSMLTRRPRIFSGLQAVVLDEIHLLDNSPRGDQLRILLNRLRLIKKGIQYCALSATIDDMSIGQRYFNDPKVCFLKSEREIDFDFIPGNDFIPRLLTLAKKKVLKKILIFFNARSYVEQFSQELNRPPFQDAVLVHHASLQKQQREDVEQQMNQSEKAILCATSTLELGIDIGDVDCVVLYRPPFNISSLLQRIGRGNRRTNTLYALGVYTNKWEELLFNIFFNCAKTGHLYEKQYHHSLSIIPQQIYSYLYQRRRIGTTMKSLYKIFIPIYSQEQIRTTFKHLMGSGMITETRPGIYFDSQKLETRITYGKIHSNIADINFGEYNVVDMATGRMVGRVFHLRNRFILAGKCWETVKIDQKEKAVYVKYVRNLPAVAKVFEGKGEGNYNYLLANVFKKELYSELNDGEFPFSADGANTYIIHMLGSLYGFLIADSLYVEGIDAVDMEGKLLILNGFQMVDKRFPVPKEETIRSTIKKNIVRLEDALGSGAYLYDLPREQQVEDHYLSLDIDGLLNFLRKLTMHELSLEDFRKPLSKLRD